MAKKVDSPYSASITGGGFLFEETEALLPMLLSPDADALLADEMLHNRCLMINAETSRKRAIAEIRRRFNIVSRDFWERYLNMTPEERRAALFFVIMKTYRIVFDFHVNVTMKKWNSISKQVELSDLLIEFDEISARDEFVDSWSDATKRKVASAYLTILRKAGMCDRTGNLRQLKLSDPQFYLIGMGEPWFLESSLMPSYEIENLKKQTV